MYENKCYLNTPNIPNENIFDNWLTFNTIVYGDDLYIWLQHLLKRPTKYIHNQYMA